MTTDIRSLDSLSMLNPLSYGDTVKLGGDCWMVKRGVYGWYLHNGAKVHPTIREIDGMWELLCAVLNTDK